MNESDKYDYVTKQAHLITDLATMLAHYLYNAATGREPSQEIVNKMNASSSIVSANELKSSMAGTVCVSL